MKIINLKASNFKRLQAIEIHPSGDVIQITGKNGAGKSSTLDAIIAAVAGKKHMPDKALRDGERKGFIELELDGLMIKRTFNAKGSSNIEVISTETGEQMRSPQGVLDALKSRLTFDPMAFNRMSLQEQIKLLQDASGCAEQINQLNDDYKGKFEERTAVNRNVKQLEAELNALPILPGNIPDEPLDIAELTAKLNEANTANNKRQSIESQMETQRANVRSVQERIDRLTKELADAKQQLADAQEKGKELAIELSGFQAIDSSSILEQLGNIQEINKQVAEKQKHTDLKARYKDASDDADKLTEILKNIKTEKLKVIQSSNLPVDGLEFDEDGVYLNGIPVEQISSGERTELSVAIGMALNPELRVMLIHDGSLLDSDRLQTIAKMAGEQDYQVWIESVDESGQVGVFIEDGMVSANNYKKQAA